MSGENRINISQPSEKEWFILKMDCPYGPYSYSELIQLLQQQKIRDHDYVFNLKLQRWKKISEVEDFSPSQISQLQRSSWSEIRAVFFRRKHARIRMNGHLLIHDEKSVVRAELKELSAGGASFEISNMEIMTKQHLKFHFRPSAFVPAFNATVEVVAVQPRESGKVLVRVRYLRIETSVQKAINEFADKMAV